MKESHKRRSTLMRKREEVLEKTQSLWKVRLNEMRTGKPQ